MSPVSQLTTRLTFRLNILAWDLSHAIWRQYGPRHDLSVAEWRVLAVVAELGEAGTREVCAVTRLHKARASRILGRLAKRGLVERLDGLTDRRTAPHRLSERGQQAHAEISETATAFEEALLSKLTPLERLGVDQAVKVLQSAVADVSDTGETRQSGALEGATVFTGKPGLVLG